MLSLPFSTLASLGAVRPVFGMVMGISLLIFAWRFSRRSGGWASRTLLFGALALAFGYVILLPMYEAGLIQRISPLRSLLEYPAAAIGWHAVKLVVMNGGWLTFGLGLALHVRLLRNPEPLSLPAPQPPHESVA